jgi:penicillin-binding protein 1A
MPEAVCPDADGGGVPATARDATDRAAATGAGGDGGTGTGGDGGAGAEWDGGEGTGGDGLAAAV